jgi:hypothetical protein
MPKDLHLGHGKPQRVIIENAQLVDTSTTWSEHGMTRTVITIHHGPDTQFIQQDVSPHAVHSRVGNGEAGRNLDAEFILREMNKEQEHTGRIMRNYQLAIEQLRREYEASKNLWRRRYLQADEVLGALNNGCDC